jgi:hypothetical protein
MTMQDVLTTISTFDEYKDLYLTVVKDNEIHLAVFDDSENFDRITSFYDSLEENCESMENNYYVYFYFKDFTVVWGYDE